MHISAYNATKQTGNMNWVLGRVFSQLAEVKKLPLLCFSYFLSLKMWKLFKLNMCIMSISPFWHLAHFIIFYRNRLLICYNTFRKRSDNMSDSLMKMWISIASMGFMFVSILMIYLSRFKINNKVLKFITAVIAYILMVVSGIIIFLVVFSGPTPD